MKTKLFILFSFIILFSCNPKKTNKVVISGEISNLKGVVYLEGSENKFNGTTSDNGAFKIVVEISQPNYFKLKTDKSEILLFLFPGDNITVEFDNNNWMQNIHFSGDRTKELIYLLDFNRLYNSVADTFDIAKYYSLDPDTFLKTVDSYKQTFLDLLNKNDRINKEFKKIEMQRIIYIWSWDKNTYPKNHLLYSKEKAKLPDDYFNYIKDLNLNDTSLMRLSDYTDFLKTYVDLKYHLKVENDSIKKYDRNLKTKIQIEVIDENFDNSKIRDYLLSNTMLSQIEDLSVDSADLARFESLCQNKNLKSNVIAKFNNISPLLKGQAAPRFKINSQSNQVISLDDFKGKYLYIDFWATYCVPCIREIPYLNQLGKDFKGKNIAFLGICIESPREHWEKIISEKKPSGIQIWLDKDQTDKIKNDFKITVEPTYVLIDKNGNFVDSRAPRPSENIKEILNKLSGL